MQNDLNVTPGSTESYLSFENVWQGLQTIFPPNSFGGRVFTLLKDNQDKLHTFLLISSASYLIYSKLRSIALIPLGALAESVCGTYVRKEILQIGLSNTSETVKLSLAIVLFALLPKVRLELSAFAIGAYIVYGIRNKE